MRSHNLQHTRGARTLTFAMALALALTLAVADRTAATEAPPMPSETAKPAGKAAAPSEKRASDARTPKKVSGAAAEEDAAYRCRPDEDIACTVVRETAQGVLIVTFRPAGTAQERKTWAVVSGTPTGVQAAGGGTVYVVPSLPQNLAAGPFHSPGAVAASLPNGAPILE